MINLLLLLSIVSASAVGCAYSPRQTPEPTVAPAQAATQQAQSSARDSIRVDTTFVKPDPNLFTRLNSGLMYRDVIMGTGTVVSPQRQLEIHYSGWLENGMMFDSSFRKGTVFRFTLGRDPVIPGWETGLLGMKAGGRRTLVIPPSLAYGAAGAGNTIPPNATLVFEVWLVSVR